MTGEPRPPRAGTGFRTLVVAWAPAVIVMAGIFFVSGLEDVSGIPGAQSDKAAHFLAYGLLGALVLRGVAMAAWSRVSWRTAAVAWLVTAAYGITDEIHQRFVPGRTSAIDDWVADAAGAAVALAVVVVLAAGLRARTRGV